MEIDVMAKPVPADFGGLRYRDHPWRVDGGIGVRDARWTGHRR
ncbi:hypothetical protein [Amycolatopsis thermoflava]